VTRPGDQAPPGAAQRDRTGPAQPDQAGNGPQAPVRHADSPAHPAPPGSGPEGRDGQAGDSEPASQVRPGNAAHREGAGRGRHPGAAPAREAGPAGDAARPPGPLGTSPPERPSLAQPSAVLDEAHLGDIEGALGRIRLDDEHRSGWRRRLVTFLAIVGPGLIVMVGDNDAGGISTYAQAGQNYGYSLLWVLLLLIPVLIVNQEMVVRLGAVTGVGHAKLINERFGRFWAWFSVGDLFLLNFLTILTEFIGVRLALSYFGVSPYVSVPVAGALLILIAVSGSFRRWERAMFVFITVNLLLIPLGIMSGPHYGSIAYHFVVPGIPHGEGSTAVLLIIAIVGTTVAPWQLFFQQSNVIDKRITPRFIKYERADTALGAFVVVGGAAIILCVAVYAVRGTPLAGHFTNALGVAHALGAKSGVLGALFAIVLLDASIIGAAAVTLSTSYAFGDVFGLKHSLHRGFRDARAFYALYSAMIALAAGLVLIPGSWYGLVTTAVQALAGVLLPSASMFLLLLCNDPEVLGPWMNPRWLNIMGSVIIGTLLMLSGTLIITTLFPHVNAAAVAGWLAVALAVGAGGTAGILTLLRARRRAGLPDYRRRFAAMTAQERMHWRMPPLALLKPVTWSAGKRLAILLMYGYLVLAVGLLVVWAVQHTGGA
jgi:Mn2+/Fe2+ NRAMP family transporter